MEKQTYYEVTDGAGAKFTVTEKELWKVDKAYDYLLKAALKIYPEEEAKRKFTPKITKIETSVMGNTASDK